MLLRKEWAGEDGDKPGERFIYVSMYYLDYVRRSCPNSEQIDQQIVVHERRVTGTLQYVHYHLAPPFLRGAFNPESKVRCRGSVLLKGRTTVSCIAKTA